MIEHGAYLLMLHAYYGTEKPLPIGRDLYRICRAFEKKERQAIDKVAALFWTRTESGFVNGRAFEEMTLASELSDIARENGSKGGRPKKPSGLSTKNPVGLKKEPRSKAIQTPDSTIQTPDSNEELRKDKDKDKSDARQRADAGTRIPLPFEITGELREWAKVKAPNVNLDEATAEFVDYWKGVPGAKGKKADWIATWRNRMRDRQERSPQGKPPRKTRFQEIQDMRNGNQE